jgi:serine/threonine-protein kinase
MKMPKFKLVTLITAIAAATVTAFAPVHAEPLPLDIQYVADGDDLGVVKDIYMNIPVSDTTQPVYGGVVRYYDVAIAQAVAITYQTCTDRNEQGANLHLTAGNRRQINMGKFYISCNLAYDMGIAYGLNEGASRPVRGYLGDYWKDMPSLNLDTDAKGQRFVNFSSNFKPVDR